MLYYIVLCCIRAYYSILEYDRLYCIVLYYIILYYDILYHIMPELTNLLHSIML